MVQLQAAMKKGPVIWTDAVTAIKNWENGAKAITLVITDAVSGERQEIDLIIPAEGIAFLHNQLLYNPDLL